MGVNRGLLYTVCRSRTFFGAVSRPPHVSHIALRPTPSLGRVERSLNRGRSVRGRLTSLDLDFFQQKSVLRRPKYNAGLSVSKHSESEFVDLERIVARSAA